MTKVQLIQPTTGPYRSNSRTGSYVPLGLVSIASYVKKKCPHTDIEIIDGEFVSHEDIIQKLDGDIIGITANTVTYPQAIELAAIAKESGAKVVLGGVYASAIPDLIWKSRKGIIDHLVVGYGEKPMVDIIKGKNSQLITNHEPPLDIVPYPDRSFVDLNEYIDTFKANHPTWPFRATNIFTNIGCEWKAKSKGGCIFCSRSGQDPAYRNPRYVWQEIQELVEEYDIDYIVDFSDSTLQNLDKFTELVESKPRDLNPQWHIFARMDEINPHTLDLVKKLPCNHIFVGIESGNPDSYGAAGKMSGSPSKSLELAKLLRDYEIELTPSYVIGLPGENERSLQNTLEHAYRLHEITGFEEIFCCQLIPFPGSTAFDMLREKENIDSDVLDVEDLKKVWAENFCDADFQLMRECCDKVLELGKYKITISKETALQACLEVQHAYIRNLQ